jgi:hypothetical protein
MSIENDKKINKKVRKCVENLYYLRHIEGNNTLNMSEKLSITSPILKNITDTLTQTHNFLLYRPLWEELHDRMVYYYEYQNANNLNNNIPLFRTVIHHNAVIWWLKSAHLGKLNGPLIHFDTHDDMGSPPNIECILTESGKFNIESLDKVCSAIDLPVSCILLTKLVNNIIWAVPTWVYDTNGTWNQYAAYSKRTIKDVCVKNKFTFLRDNSYKLGKDKFPIGCLKEDVDPKYIKSENFEFLYPFKFSKVHPKDLDGWKKLYEFLEPKKYGNKFILDIDLDYFACNGNNITRKRYMDTYEDLQSTGRVHGIPGIKTPRSMFEDKDGESCIINLNKEVKLIKKRVKLFLSGLKYLKKNGLTPSVIDISDSTMSLFSGNFDGALFTNEYCPKYFVPYIHYLLLSGFSKLYKL